VKIHQLTATDGFIAFDLDDAPSTGVTRLARKVLQDGARLLARSTTYAFASFGLRMGGGSAGVNAEGDAVEPALAAFVGEARALVQEGRWTTDPGTGVSEEGLAPLRSVDPRPPELWTGRLSQQLVALGAIAAARAVGDGGLGGTTAAVVGGGPVVDATRLGLDRAEVTVAEGSPDADCDLLFVAGKAGIIDHDVAETVRAGVVVPLTPVPVTARAHAVLSHAGRVHVPDFLSTAAPLLHAHDREGGDPVNRIEASVAELAGEGTGLWMAAAVRAEEFMRSWLDELPFGRPLA
jgi:hypothetical protein